MSIISERLKFELDVLNTKYGPETTLDALAGCIASIMYISWAPSVYDGLIDALGEDIRDHLARLKRSNLPIPVPVDSDELN